MAQEFDSEILRKIESEGTDSVFFEHLLSTLLNTFPDHIYLKDTESRFLLINKSLLKQFGLKKSSEAIGKTDFDFFSKDHASEAFEDEQNIMKSCIE